MPDGTQSTSTRVLILPGFPSLPHMLLTTFTTTLLPIIPQLEDFECTICGDVAFKPCVVPVKSPEFAQLISFNQQDPSRLQSQVLRPLPRQDAEARTGRLSAMPAAGRAPGECS